MMPQICEANISELFHVHMKWKAERWIPCYQRGVEFVLEFVLEVMFTGS